jgi:hypothetical protein
MLTDLKIDRLKPTNKPMRFADRDGLTLEVRPSGKKMFLFRFQWDKKPQTITLGRYPSLRLAEARKKALEHRVSLNQGIDPRRGTGPTVKEKFAFKKIAEQWFIKNAPSFKH